MRWALIFSLILHGFAFTLIFKRSERNEIKYPSVMMVRLAMPPAQKGVQTPATPKTVQEPPPKPVKKEIEAAKPETRVAEVHPRKRPKREFVPASQPAVREAERKSETTSEAMGLPEGVELGSEFGAAKLDVSGFDSPYYLNVLFSKIRRAWDNPYQGVDTVRSTIYFVVSREGRIIDSAIETSSGILAYDQAALRAVLGSKPPPLPGQFTADELGIHLLFQYIPQ